MKTRRKRPAKRGVRKEARVFRLGRWSVSIALVALLACALALVDWRVRSAVASLPHQEPARLFARALELVPSTQLTRARLVFELDLLGYVDVRSVNAHGEYSFSRDSLQLWPRGPSGVCRFPLQIAFDSSGQVSSIRDADGRSCRARLEPFEFAHLGLPGTADREYLPLESIPALQVAALLAIEDRNHFRHPGIDPFAILRAVWVNLRAGEVRQGGSTLTQQLAKNLFTDGERSFWRKLVEVSYVLALELRFDKLKLLEAYLNEVYMGQDGPRAIRGIARGARFWFGRPLEELGLHQFALLAALARGANAYNPRQHPERALERRNRVLDAIAELGWAAPELIAQARQRPLDVTPRAKVHGARFPALLRPLREELRLALGRRAETAVGLSVHTGLDPWLQMRAEWAVDEGLERHLRGVPAAQGVQAAVVVLDAADGTVRALVGGRDRNPEAFNRALSARRPVGSLMKPLVALVAFSSDSALHPASRFDDTPPQLRDADGRPWRPDNHDGKRHGEVTLAESMVRSLNVPFVRLALAVGLPRLASFLDEVGAPVAGRPWPSLALGAHGMTPLEVARAYLSLSAEHDPGGVVWIEAVTGDAGDLLWQAKRLQRKTAAPLARPMVRSMMAEAARSGTARGISSAFPGHGALAAKTGTTDDRRDSWFAAFGADLLGVVWVGHDDNRPTGLTGAMGALPVWLDVFAHQPPRPLPTQAPAGLEWTSIDARTGRQVAASCPGSLRVLLPVERLVPSAGANCR